jgi:hypothetical protein
MQLLEAYYYLKGKLEFVEEFRGNLFYLEANYFASVEIEANSRGKFSIRGKLFLGKKRGHFLFGGNSTGTAAIPPTGRAKIVLVFKEGKVNKELNQSYRQGTPQDQHQ